MTYSLSKRARTNDFDILDETGTPIGQVVTADSGFAVYLLGDFERLLEPSPTAMDALEAFEEWAASNTLSDILVVDPTRRPDSA